MFCLFCWVERAKRYLSLNLGRFYETPLTLRNIQNDPFYHCENEFDHTDFFGRHFFSDVFTQNGTDVCHIV